LLIAQDPQTASEPEMPARVIDDGAMDFVLAPHRMPHVLLAFRASQHRAAAAHDTLSVVSRSGLREADRRAEPVAGFVRTGRTFFHDPAAFGELAPAVAALAKERDESRPIRIWIVGCGAGEEAYSVAIVAA